MLFAAVAVRSFTIEGESCCVYVTLYETRIEFLVFGTIAMTDCALSLTRVQAVI